MLVALAMGAGLWIAGKALKSMPAGSSRGWLLMIQGLGAVLLTVMYFGTASDVLYDRLPLFIGYADDALLAWFVGLPGALNLLAAGGDMRRPKLPPAPPMHRGERGEVKQLPALAVIDADTDLAPLDTPPAEKQSKEGSVGTLVAAFLSALQPHFEALGFAVAATVAIMLVVMLVAGVAEYLMR